MSSDRDFIFYAYDAELLRSMRRILPLLSRAKMSPQRPGRLCYRWEMVSQSHVSMSGHNWTGSALLDASNSVRHIKNDDFLPSCAELGPMRCLEDVRFASHQFNSILVILVSVCEDIGTPPQFLHHFSLFDFHSTISQFSSFRLPLYANPQ